MRRLSIWEVGIFHSAVISCFSLFTVDTTEKSAYMYSKTLYIVASIRFGIKFSDSGECRISGAGCSPYPNQRVSSVNSCVLCIGSYRQFSCSDSVYHFSSWTMENNVNLYFLTYPLSFVFLLLYLRLIKSVRVRLRKIGFRSDKIRPDVFRCGSFSAQYKSIKSNYCNTQGSSFYFRFPTEPYWCRLIF